MTLAIFKEMTTQELFSPLETDGEVLELYLAYREYYYKNKETVQETFDEYMNDIFGHWETDTHGNQLDYDRLNCNWG